MSQDVVVLVSAGDRPGLLADTASYVRDIGGNIVEAEQHTIPGLAFVQRMVVSVPADQRIESMCDEIAALTSGVVTCHLLGTRTRIALFVSKAGHAAYDVMSKVALDENPIDVACIVSDQSHHADLARRFEVPFVEVKVDGRTREEHESAVLLALEDFDFDLVVLARYMRILSADFLEKINAPAINVHHSLLPAFIGAGAYQRAWDRGVKLIGATAHYATVDLDEGPIIAQASTAVHPFGGPENMVSRGRELECTVLAQALSAHCQFRVLLTGNRTIIFEN